MKKSSRILFFWAVLGLVIVTAACAPKTSTPTSKPNTQAQPTTAATSSANSSEQKSGGNATVAVSCDQIVPPDEVNLLLNRVPAKLEGQSAPGMTTCTWQYTSKSSGQNSFFQVQVGYDTSAVDAWNAARKAELSTQPSDLVINKIDGLGEENYTWMTKANNQRAVYVRRGTQTLILHYQTADILFLGTESGTIDMADRIFDRLNR